MSCSSPKTSLLIYMPCVLPCPTCFMPYVSSFLTGLVPYIPRALHALASHVPPALHASCPTCFHATRASFLTFSRALRSSPSTCLVTYVLLVVSCSTCLVTYLFSCLMCLVHYVPFALCVSRQTCSRVSRILPALAPHCLKLCVSSICLKLYVLFCSLSLTCFKCSKSNMLSCMSCLVAFMSLLCFCWFNYLSFLQSRLRLITVLDRNKDTPNLNYINTLYPLRIATCVKNEFQNLQTGFQSNRGGFGWLCLCLKFKI